MIRRKPIRVQFTPTSRTSTRDPGTMTAAAIMNAADERSPGTVRLCASSASARARLTSAPERRTATPAPASMRSVWSRLGAGSVTVVSPSADSPAISTQDFTWALATGRT